MLFGWVATKKSGTTFAMISLGIGEMVAAACAHVPGFFGGEGGVTANRIVGPALLGITYGPPIQVYYLIAGWTFAAWSRCSRSRRRRSGASPTRCATTPSAPSSSATTRTRVRSLLVLSAFFAGVAGGLAAINYEIVTAENVGIMRSGVVLLATFIGGVGLFFGPVIGAVVFTFFVVWIAERDQGVAPVPRALLRGDGDVRAGRHREPDRRQPAGGEDRAAGAAAAVRTARCSSRALPLARVRRAGRR